MYCDKLYAMKEGRIVGSGTPKALLTREFISEVYEVDAQIYHGKDDQIHIFYHSGKQEL